MQILRHFFGDRITQEKGKIKILCDGLSDKLAELVVDAGKKRLVVSLIFKGGKIAEEFESAQVVGDSDATLEKMKADLYNDKEGELYNLGQDYSVKETIEVLLKGKKVKSWDKKKREIVLI